MLRFTIMRSEDHAKRSLEFILAHNPSLSVRHRKKIARIILKLHEWMDQYHNTKGEGYDYTGINVMKHWEQLHHHEGAKMAAQHFAGRYGIEYHAMVLEEAYRHIRDDLGEVPDQSFYRQIGIWKQLRGF